MPKIWEPKPKEVLSDWIETIETEASDELNEWESKFVESVSSQLNRYGKLSQRQEEILERIYAEKTS